MHDLWEPIEERRSTDVIREGQTTSTTDPNKQEIGKAKAVIGLLSVPDVQRLVQHCATAQEA